MYVQLCIVIMKILKDLGLYITLGDSQYLGNQSTTEVLIKNVGTFFSPEENVVYGFFLFWKKCVRPMRGQY